MENAVYYTLSTIAQTLAGALAILVAVVLFKLSALVQTIERGKETLRTLNLLDFVRSGPSREIKAAKSCYATRRPEAFKPM